MNSLFALSQIMILVVDGSGFVLIFAKYSERCETPCLEVMKHLTHWMGACYFSTFDLASGYWHVEVHPKDKKKLHPLGFISLV